MARVLANSSRKHFEAFALPSVRGSDSDDADQHDGEHRRHQPERRRKPTICSRKPPTKKPAPFVAFFEPVNQATQRNNCPRALSDVALIALFEAVLVRSLATPAMPCAATTQATEAAAPQAGSSADSMHEPGDLQDQAGHQHARDAEARRQPAAAEIGEDAGRLVQQEQERQHERRVAEAVEVQQHQHAHRAVGEREQEIRAVTIA